MIKATFQEKYMQKVNSIVIGAGLGGLSCAAKLSQSNKKVLILEKSNFIGGKCSSRYINSGFFDIGAVFFGNKIKKILNKELGIEHEFYKVILTLKSSNSSISLPLGIKTFFELKKCGIKNTELLAAFPKLLLHTITNLYQRKKTFNELVDQTTRSKILRNILKVGCSYVGFHPGIMPGYYFNGLYGNRYGYDKPLYPKGGAIAIAKEIEKEILHNNGKFLFSKEVNKIIVKNNKATGVQIGNEIIHADEIISNASSKTTINNLVGKDKVEKEFCKKIGKNKDTLAMNAIFVKFSKNIKLPANTSLLIYIPKDVCEDFDNLNNGIFSSDPDTLFGIHIPTNIDNKLCENYHCGTIFYYNPLNFSDELIIAKKGLEILKLIDKIIPHFNKNIIDYEIISANKYSEKLGINSKIGGIAESIYSFQVPNKLPIKNLYCVGDSTYPEIGCAVQAIISGINCADLILTESKE